MILKLSKNGGEATNLRILYLGYYMALGAFLPYASLYYERSGLNGVQIGVLSALLQITVSLTAIPWGTLADRFRLHHRILSVAFLLAGFFVLMLSLVSSYALMIPLVLGYALFVAPIVPLLDSSTMAVTKASGVSFGEVRVGGTIGWIISVALVGLLIQRFNIHWLFYAYVACIGFTLLYALSRPVRTGSVPATDWSKLRVLLTERSVVIFLTSVFLVMVANGAVQNFFSLYMDGIGAGEGIIGMAWAVAAVSEIPVMMYSGRIISRIGSKGLLTVAFFAYAARWLLLSFIRDPAWALAAQLLHGVSFAAFLTAGVTYLNERTPEGMGATAQAIFSVVSYGLAAFVGSLTGGYLYDHASMAWFFRIFSMVAAAGLLLFWMSPARPRRAAYGSDL